MNKEGFYTLFLQSFKIHDTIFFTEISFVNQNRLPFKSIFKYRVDDGKSNVHLNEF